jgi:ribosome-binding protein aMBF1 (putative translation factor)
LLKETPRSGAWIPTSPRVDLARLDATTDADINHQRIAELVDEALQVSMSSVAELAVALQLSPSTIRRWRRGAASPTATNLRRLRERLGLRS